MRHIIAARRRGAFFLWFLLIAVPMFLFAFVLAAEITMIVTTTRSVRLAAESAAVAGTFMFDPDGSGHLDVPSAIAVSEDTFAHSMSQRATGPAIIINQQARVIVTPLWEGVRQQVTFQVPALRVIKFFNADFGEVTITEQAEVCLPGESLIPDGYCRRPDSSAIGGPGSGGSGGSGLGVSGNLPPGAPRGPNPMPPGDVNSAISAVFTANDPDDTSLRFELGASSTGPFSQTLPRGFGGMTVVGTGKTATVTFTPLPDVGGDYDFWIRAVDPSGNESSAVRVTGRIQYWHNETTKVWNSWTETVTRTRTVPYTYMVTETYTYSEPYTYTDSHTVTTQEAYTVTETRTGTRSVLVLTPEVYYDTFERIVYIDTWVPGPPVTKIILVQEWRFGPSGRYSVWVTKTVTTNPLVRVRTQQIELVVNEYIRWLKFYRTVPYTYRVDVTKYRTVTSTYTDTHVGTRQVQGTRQVERVGGSVETYTEEVLRGEWVYSTKYVYS